MTNIIAKAELSREQLLERIAILEKNQKSAGVGKISFKVAPKGGVSVYGLGRFPVTLYQEQWPRLLAPEVVTELLAFIEVNKSQLATKPVGYVTQTPTVRREVAAA